MNRYTLTMSVAKFNTVNCDDSYGAIIEDMLSAALHSSGTFTIVDTVQKERTASKASDSSANNRTADQGKTTTIDKTIVGSVAKSAGLIITVMSIDTKSADIDIVITEKIGNNTDIKKTIGKISEEIRHFYLVQKELKKKTEITVKATSFFPVGVYSKYLYPSYGVVSTLSVNRIAGDNFSLFFSSGINNFPAKQDRYRKFTQLYAAGGPSGRFCPLNSMIISPRAGVGSVWTMMEYDADGIRNSEGFRYENKFFHNYCILFETEISFHMKEQWMFSISNGFMRILDKSNSGSLFFLSAGIKSLY